MTSISANTNLNMKRRMNKRTKSILEASVEEFIRTGVPVTSDHLYERHDFGIQSAMIRWELKRLCDDGYLYQLHPSGGRYPSNKAYRFLVSQLLIQEDASENGDRSVLGRELALKQWKEFTDDLADTLNVFGVCYEEEEKNVWTSGLSDLFMQLEVETKQEMAEVAGDVERLPHRIKEQEEHWSVTSEWPRVFIGKNALTKSSHLSVIAHRLEGGTERVMLLAIGPKRMNYRRSLNLFRFLERSWSEATANQ